MAGAVFSMWDIFVLAEHVGLPPMLTRIFRKQRPPPGTNHTATVPGPKGQVWPLSHALVQQPWESEGRMRPVPRGSRGGDIFEYTPTDYPTKSLRRDQAPTVHPTS